MREYTSNAIGVKDRHAELTNRLRGEPDPTWNAAQERQRRGLPQPLIIDGRRKLIFADPSDDFAHGFVGTSFRLPDFRCQFAALDQRFPARMRQPNDFSFRERFTKAGDGGKRVDDVTEGTETHNQKTRLRHAAPCEWNPEGL